jgi:nicotinate phosphoribosyltransferase
MNESKYKIVLPPDNRYTDKYFEKTQNCCDDETTATYGVFLRHDSICAIQPALDFITENAVSAKITRHYEEGSPVPAERALFSYEGILRELVVLETEMLQRVGIPCRSAYNAYQMATACPQVAFLDMHARHASGTDMVLGAAYGASVGSRTAKLHGAKGFIGSSLDITASFYGTEKGLGTMPHVLIGLAGSTLDAVKLFMEKNPDDTTITALIDFYGREISDALEVAEWWDREDLGSQGKKLSFRLDTHGGRFAERLDYEKSVALMGRWLHQEGEWQVVRHVLGEDVFEIATDSIRDRVRAILFGKGVSAANIINLREKLDQFGHQDMGIVASSGFNLRKCKIMAKAAVPIDVIGTGSFLPETLAETYATCDCFKYNGKFSVKVGREAIFKGL